VNHKVCAAAAAVGALVKLVVVLTVRYSAGWAPYVLRLITYGDRLPIIGAAGLASLPFSSERIGPTPAEALLFDVCLVLLTAVEWWVIAAAGTGLWRLRRFLVARVAPRG
jgi:hypothetical protein